MPEDTTRRQATDLDALLTLDEAAALLRLSRYTLYKMAAAGRIPAMKAGRQWRFSRRDLHEWLKANAKPK